MTSGEDVIAEIIRADLIDSVMQAGNSQVIVWKANSAEQIEAALSRLGLVPMDDTLGDVVAAYVDGTVVLDDGISVYNPIRALEFVKSGGVLQ